MLFGLACVAAVVVFGAFALVLEIAAPERQFVAAEARWRKRDFIRYRFAIEGDNGRCRQESLVQGEQVTKVVDNTCRIPARTVTSLFRLIRLTPPATYQCVEHGCACDTVMNVETAYDPRFGYPRYIGFYWSVRPNLLHGDYWRYIWDNGRLPSCRATQFSRVITITSLTPNP
jgi:hypothetical protein